MAKRERVLLDEGRLKVYNKDIATAGYLLMLEGNLFDYAKDTELLTAKKQLQIVQD
jgi:hypothetical protein